MSVTVSIPSPLRQYCKSADELHLTAQTVREALTQIERIHPPLFLSVCDETGAVRRHINVYVNSSHMRDLQGLDTPLAPGDTLTLMPAVSGG